MSESPFIHDASTADFQALVIENSFKQPVLVDFWADWCNPCQMLMPVLSKLAEEYQGKFILVKVNSDQNQELAGQLGVRSLPTVKLIKDGQVVDEFMGALPESEIRAFLDKHITSATSAVLELATQAFDNGQHPEAMEILNQALASDPDNATLKIEIATLISDQGDTDSALALLDSLSPEDRNNELAKNLLAKINLSKQLQGLPERAELEQRVHENADDLQAKLQLSQHLSAAAEYAESMALLLDIMKADRKFENDAGRTSLLALFEILGNEHPDAQTFRRKMFALLH